MGADSTSLALLGGVPAFAEPVHVGRPNLGERARFHARMDQIFDERWLTNQGPQVRELEERLAAYVGVRHCIAVANATLGLEVTARAAGLTGEVIVPAFTFVATAHALDWLGLTPVFCDIDPATHNLDPERVEDLITDRTSAIVGVHLWGRPCAVAPLEDVAARHGLTLLFDAAHAFGATHEGRPLGSHGSAEVFSFHATKFINAFEGGAITTDDDELAGRLRLARNFGFADVDQIVSSGTNAKMSEASAAMAHTSLDSIEVFLRTNRRNHERYQQELRAVDGVDLLTYDEREHANFQYVVVEIDPAATGLTRDEVLAVLLAENVLARRYFHPGCHRVEPYRTRDPQLRLPATESVASRVLALPTGTAIDEHDVVAITGLVRRAIAAGPQLHASGVLEGVDGTP